MSEEADDKPAVHPKSRTEAALRHAEDWADKHSENGVSTPAGGIMRQLVQIIMEQSDELVSLLKPTEPTASESEKVGVLVATALISEVRSDVESSRQIGAPDMGNETILRLAAALERSQIDLANAISLRDSWHAARDIRNSLWLDEKARADAAGSPAALIDWLISIQYPFDMTFDPAPPVDVRILALAWKKHDGWVDLSDEEAIVTVSELSGIPFTPTTHPDSASATTKTGHEQ